MRTDAWRQLCAAGAAGAAAAAMVLVAGRAWLPQAKVSEPRPVSVPSAADPAERLHELQRALDAEAEARETLEFEVAMMRTVIEQLAAARSGAPGDRADAQPTDSNAPAPAVAPASSTPGFRAELLAEAGVDERAIGDLRTRWEELKLNELYLSDRAAREGWLLSPRHRRELAQVRSQVRAELGDEAYDQMLYATGAANRMEVVGVLSGSQAESLGLRAGDMVVSYAGVRVFEGREIRRLTRAGEVGETVRLVYVRDGETDSVPLARGPIGVQLQAAQAPPLP